jgi:quinol monooxygenase YgiN
MINVKVTLRIRAGMEAAAEELLRQLETETTENDAGCLRYQWYRSEQPGMYVLLERWASQAAVDAHFQAEHMTRLLPQITECAVEPFKAIRLARLE